MRAKHTRGGTRHRSTWNASKGIKVKRAAAFRDVNAPWGVTDAWSEQSSEVRGRERVLQHREAVRCGAVEEEAVDGRTLESREAACCGARRDAGVRRVSRLVGLLGTQWQESIER